MDGGPFTNLWENNNRVLTSWLWKINTVLDHISPMKSQNLILGPHIMASSRFAISSGACSAMRSLHSWKLFVFNLQFLVVSTCLNPMLLLLNLQMSVGLLRILLVPKPDKIAGQAGRAQKKPSFALTESINWATSGSSKCSAHRLIISVTPSRVAWSPKPGMAEIDERFFRLDRWGFIDIFQIGGWENDDYCNIY